MRFAFILFILSFTSVVEGGGDLSSSGAGQLEEFCVHFERRFGMVHRSFSTCERVRSRLWQIGQFEQTYKSGPDFRCWMEVSMDGEDAGRVGFPRTPAVQINRELALDSVSLLKRDAEGFSQRESCHTSPDCFDLRKDIAEHLRLVEDLKEYGFLSDEELERKHPNLCEWIREVSLATKAHYSRFNTEAGQNLRCQTIKKSGKTMRDEAIRFSHLIVEVAKNADCPGIEALAGK